MASKALTMIKESLTSGFLRSAKSIGYPSGKGMSGAAGSGPLPKDDPEGDPKGAQADAMWHSDVAWAFLCGCGLNSGVTLIPVPA
jgi:hypothetical protein